MLDPTEMAAQTDSVDNLPSGAEPSSPPEPEASGSPAELSPEVRARLASAGRETANERQRREQAEQQVVQLSGQLNAAINRLTGVEQYLARQQQEEQEAELSALPPEQRVLREVENLKAQLARQQQAASAPPLPAPRETPQQYQARRTREMVEEANQDYSLNGRMVITGNESVLDTSSEQAFKASIRALAATRAEFTPTEETNVAKKPAAQETPAEMETRIAKQVRAEVMKELGVGGSNSARPSSTSIPDDPTRADYDKVAYNRRPGDGMMATKQKLREIRDNVRANQG